MQELTPSERARLREDIGFKSKQKGGRVCLVESAFLDAFREDLKVTSIQNTILLDASQIHLRPGFSVVPCLIYSLCSL
jgi:hypothetical protein